MASRSIAAAALLALCASNAALAQSPAPQNPAPQTAPPQTASSAKSPLHFTISTDKSSYHVGEAIQVKMDFTADVEHVFRIVPESTATEDDSLDNLSRNPVELAPPYDQNTAQLVRRDANSHNHFPPIALGPSGSHYALLLNNRYALKKPGVLHLTIVSRRVSADLGDTTANANGDPASAPPFPVTSNTLTITILPATPEWQAAELADIEKQLDTTLPDASGAPSPERQQAIDRLIYLNSPGAARELVRRFATAPPIEQDALMTGMALSDHRDAAIDAANKLATDPSFGITRDFELLISVLPALDKLEEADTTNGAADLLENARAAAEPQLLADLSTKQGKALATTLATLEQTKAETATPAEAAAIQQALPKLIAIFPDLPPEEQDEWLTELWPDVRDPAWTTVLKNIATAPQPFGAAGERFFPTGATVKGDALEHWAALDPDGARATILTAMMSNDPQFGPDALLALPDKTLPDAQQRQLAQLFLTAADSDAQRHFAEMLERYGGDTAWRQVSTAVSQSMRNYPCDTQVHLLSFAFSVVPDAANDLLDSAMAPPDNGSTECRAQILSASIRSDTPNAREKYAIAALSESNLTVVESAARFLQAHGSAKAEDPLWKRYESWALAAAAVAPAGNGPLQLSDTLQFQLGSALAEAIEQGRGWLTGREKLERLNTLAGDHFGKPMVTDDVLAGWMRSPVVVNCEMVSDTESQFNIAQYTMNGVDELKARLALFPSGTTLAWDAHACTSQSNYSAMFNDIASAASMKDVTLKSVDELPAGTLPPPATNEANDDGAPAPSNDSGNTSSPDAANIVPDRVVVVN